MSLGFTVSEAMNSELLFEPFFHGPSWDAWRAVIKAAFAEPMNDAELALFRSVAERDPPQQRVSELVCACGRGAGKDSIASLLATMAAINFDPRGRLRPGERATIMCLACDKSQAGIAFNYVKGYFETIPALRATVRNFGAESIELINGVEIIVSTNNFRGVRGRTFLCTIFDEAAFFRDINFASPDIELDAAIAPGLARMPNSMKIIISSVHKRAGLLYQKVRDYYGKNDAHTLVIVGETLKLNPTFDEGIIARALQQDLQRYSAEYLCKWRDDISSYIGMDLLDAAVDSGTVVRPPSTNIRYVAACDASGGRNNSFTAAIAHKANEIRYVAACDASGGRNNSFTAAIAHKANEGTVVLDALFERHAPFNPTEAVADIAALMGSYECHQITGDHYSANWVIEAFSKVGVGYIQSNRERSAIYIDTLPLFTAGRVRLLDNKKLISQFANLERRTFSTGRERVDPGPGHDDLANSCAIALTLIGGAHAAELIRYSDVLVQGAPVAVPPYASALYATMAADDDGLTATVFACRTYPQGTHQDSVVILDFNVEFFRTDLFARMREHLISLSCQTRSGNLTLVCPKVLAIEAQRAGLAGVSTIPDHLEDVTGLKLTVASLAGAGRVKLSATAEEKGRTLGFGGALTFKPGIDVRQDALRMASIWTVICAFEGRSQYAH